MVLKKNSINLPFGKKKQNPEITFGVFHLIKKIDQYYFALSRVIVFVG